MGTLLLTATLLMAAPSQAPESQDPAETVRDAMAAVERDRIDAAERVWRRAFSRDSTDRVAMLGLATLAHHTYHDSTAERLYRAAANETDRAGGYAALGLARLAAFRARWQLADSAAAMAAAAALASNDSSLDAQALIVGARARAANAGADAAMTMLAEASSIVAERDSVVRAERLCASALVRALQNDVRGAVRDALDGARLAEAARDQRSVGRCQFTAAREYTRLFRPDSSLMAYDRAVTAFRSTRDRAGLASALYERADHWLMTGRLGLARRDGEEAVREARAAGRTSTAAWAMTTLAQISRSVGDWRDVSLKAAEIKRLHDLTDDPVGRMVAASYEANIALALDDAAGARTSYLSAIEYAKEIGDYEFVPGAWSGLTWAAMLAGDGSAARSAIDSARTYLAASSMGAHGESLSFLEGTMALRAGRFDDAERLFRGRLAAASARGGRHNYVDAARLAEALMRQGRLDEAEHEIHAATESLDAWRESLGDRQLQRLAFQSSADRADPDLGFASVIAALAADGRIESAFELVERGRARDLGDRLNRAAALDTADSPAVRSSAPITLDGLQSALPDDSIAVFEYVTGRGDPTTLFVITRTNARTYILPPRDSIIEPIARLAALVQAEADIRPLGERLGDALLAPALAELDPAVRRVIVVPDGPLHRLPFDLLVMPDGRFVVARFAVAVAPSATVAMLLREREPATPPAGLVVLADPEFADESSDVANDADVFRSARAGRAGMPRLEGSSREARAVARYSEQSTVRTRGDASESWLKNASLSSYGVIHIATHALVDDESITNTALALAPDEREDGFIGIGELAGLSLDAELVVLSACRTAGGRLVRGEGVQGLATPLLVAGARAVAATWWPIGDQATVRLVDDFYRAMAVGQPAADAMRTAKLAALERGATAREWAAFTLVGDPLAHPDLRVPSDRRMAPVWLAVGLAIILLGYIASSLRRRI